MLQSMGKQGGEVAMPCLRDYSAGSQALQQRLILYVGNVPIEPTTGGSVVLYRHLDHIGSTVDVQKVRFEAPVRGRWGLLRRIAAMLSRVGMRKWGESLHVLIAGRWADGAIEAAVELQSGQDIVLLTVAHGDLAVAAARVAKKKGVPLVTVFHDWWPDIVPLTSWGSSLSHRQFIDLHAASAVSLPVSDGMREQLGEHPECHVLFPIPHAEDEVPAAQRDSRPIRLLYSGNLAEYGASLREAMIASGESRTIRLEVRGQPVRWPKRFVRTLKQDGRLLDFAPRPQFEQWIDSAGAFLVPMSFEKSMRRRVETSFPSKLTEFSRYGRPIVVWGPPYCTAVRWAQKSGAALVFTKPDGAELIEFLERFLVQSADREEFGRRARSAYDSCFSPEQLQRQFIRAIELAEVTTKD